VSDCCLAPNVKFFNTCRDQVKFDDMTMVYAKNVY